MKLLAVLILLIACSTPVKTPKKVAVAKPPKELPAKPAKKKKKSVLKTVRVYMLAPQNIQFSDAISFNYTDGDVSEAAALRAFKDGIEYYQHTDADLDLVIHSAKKGALRLNTRKHSGETATVFEPERLAAFCRSNNIIIDENAYVLYVGKLRVKEGTSAGEKSDFIDSTLDFALVNTETGKVRKLGVSSSSITFPKYTLAELKTLGKQTVDKILEQIFFLH